MKQFGKPPLSKRTPSPFQLTPYFWAIFSWPLSLSKFQKQDPPLILGGRGEEETMGYQTSIFLIHEENIVQ